MKLSDYAAAIIILAAGRGQRMGIGPGSKLLLPLPGGETVIERTIRTAAAFGPTELVVVIRPDEPAISNAVVGTRFIAPNIRAVSNPRYEEGMATSLAAGVEALGDRIEAALVMLGDMPFVAPGIVEALMIAYANEHKPITIPKYGGAVGPPTLFARSVFPDLLGLRGDVGGRQLVDMHPGSACLVSFKEEDRPPDIDTPEDMRRLK